MISVAAISWKAVTDLKRSKQMHMVTKSDWIRITKEIQDIRDDSDKHQSLLMKLEGGFSFIERMLTDIDRNVRKLETESRGICPLHAGIEDKIKEIKLDMKGKRDKG